MTRRRSYAGERGQTLPLWAMSVILGMTMVLFVFNYSNTVRYAIRAQNAADSAAAAALGNDAAALNSSETLLAAFDIQELRVRDVAAAVPSLLTSDTNCSGATALLSQACTGDLTHALSLSPAGDLAKQVATLQTVATTLNTFSGQLTDRLSSPGTAVTSLFAPNGTNGCAVAVLTDCDYKYTTKLTYGANGLPTVDEYTCKKVPNLGAGFLRLGAANQSFYAIGHATATLNPLNVPYSNGSLPGALQSTSSAFPSVSSSNLIGSLANLNVQSKYYVPGAAPPVPGAVPPALTTVCP